MLSSEEQSQSEDGFIGGLVAGVLIVVALAVIVTSVIFYIRRSRKGSLKLHSTVKYKEGTNIQLCSLEIENPLYSGELIISSKL